MGRLAGLSRLDLAMSLDREASILLDPYVTTLWEYLSLDGFGISLTSRTSKEIFCRFQRSNKSQFQIR